MESNSALFAAAGAWIAQDPDAHTQEHLRQLLQAQDAQALWPLFNGRIAFGTAGLRAIMGPGPKAMGRLVVRQSTLGILQHLSTEVHDVAQRGVVVAYDGRLGSAQMAMDAAGVAAAQGVHVHLFDAAVPTPVAGYAVKNLRAAAGFVITASHNPPAYNGLKVFWHNAAQIVPPTDSLIAQAIDEVAARPGLSPMPCLSLEEMKRLGRVTCHGQDMIAGYLAAIASLSHHPPSAARAALGIAYTPLHGVGAEVAEAAMRRAGFTSVYTVTNQREPDGRFPTVPFPNPEEAGSMDEVLRLAESTGAALACANDPDADRLAVAARTREGKLTALTGDELGLLLADDLLAHDAHRAAVGTTLVSGRGLKRLAAAYGAFYFETLTGFKWLAFEARTQTQKDRRFVFAYEEALGYAIGDVVWDKDGISALLAVANLAAALHEQDLTLWDRLEAISRVVGVAVSAQATLSLNSAKAAATMTALRDAPPARVGAFEVSQVYDLQRPSDAAALGLPVSNVIILQLRQAADGPIKVNHARIIVRPSGTEPKVKCYYDMIAHWPKDGAWATVRTLTLSAMHEVMRAHAKLLQKE